MTAVEYIDIAIWKRPMRIAAAVLAFSALAIAPIARADASPAQILDANRAAAGGAAWDGKTTLTLDYRYAGQGLTGKTHSLEDLQRGAFVDSYRIGPNSGANGYDGVRAWLREPSGTVTNQAGGDVLPLAVNEAYRDRNLWWRADRDGAAITADGQQTDGGRTYDVLTVTPKDGKSFQAWFDSKTHLLARTIELQVTQTITTVFSDYAPVEGALIARVQVVDDGSGPAGRQTFTLTAARFSPALDRSAYTQPKADLHDFSMIGGVSETTVPFQLINNHIYADVSINGHPLHTFIFDTGGHDILTTRTAKTLGVKAQGALTASGAGDALAQSGVAMVDSISVGAATLTHQPISTLDFSGPGVEGVEEGGMIGYEFFARFITRIDYGARTITFIDKAHFDPRDAGTPVPMALFGQFPEVRGTYDGIPGRFGIDTGSRMTLDLNRPFVERNNLRKPTTKGTEATVGWGVGGPSRGFAQRGGPLKIGDVTIPAPLTILSLDKGGAGGSEAFPNNIGGGLLKRFVVTLDYDHDLIYLKPIKGPIADLDAFDRAGLWINAVADGLRVVDVSTGTPAADAGLKKDDLIVAVDGQAAAGVNLSDLRARLRDDPPGTVVTFSVKRGAIPQDIKLTLRDLI